MVAARRAGISAAIHSVVPSATGLDWLAEKGYKTVLDLREEAEFSASFIADASRRGLRYVALPLTFGLGPAAGKIPALPFNLPLLKGGLLTGVDRAKAIANYIKALNKGILKVMAKMGISTLQSYTGAQIFEAIGLNRELVDRYFSGTASRVSGIGLDMIAEEVRRRHGLAFPERPVGEPDLEPGGEYQWRRDGEYHLFNPENGFVHRFIGSLSGGPLGGDNDYWKTQLESGWFHRFPFGVFGARLRFPIDFVGRGDMSRGGLLMRCAEAGRELEYAPVAGAVLHGARPPKLPPKRWAVRA